MVSSEEAVFLGLFCAWLGIGVILIALAVSLAVRCLFIHKRNKPGNSQTRPKEMERLNLISPAKPFNEISAQLIRQKEYQTKQQQDTAVVNGDIGEEGTTIIAEAINQDEEKDYNIDNSLCAICLEEMGKVEDSQVKGKADLVRMLPCSHIFHDKCITSWIPKKPRCPVCQRLW